MIIKNANTIAQYKIMRWVEKTFYEDAVTVDFIDNESAIIADKAGDHMLVYFDPLIDVVVRQEE